MIKKRGGRKIFFGLRKRFKKWRFENAFFVANILKLKLIFEALD